MSTATIKKRFAASMFPRYYELLDQVNANAKVRSWILQNGDVPSFDNKRDIYAYLSTSVIGDVPIDYLEFGVYKGATMRSWLPLNTNAESRFIGFDSFEGLPEDWSKEIRRGTFDAGGQLPQIDDPRVTFVRGWFQDTLPAFLDTFTPQAQRVVHLDCDLYSSALYCLTMLDRLMVAGTLLLFDEFTTPLHEFRAFHDYINAYRRTLRPLAVSSDYATQAAFIFE